MANIDIRPAKKEDMLTVFRMIKELANYERMPEAVLINEASLIKYGFETEPPLFTCYVAEVNQNRIVGFALYTFCYSTWVGRLMFLQDIFIEEDYRKLGCQIDFRVKSWNPASKFYKRMGAVDITIEEDWHIFRFDRDTLSKLAE
ncbi:hypothetical protein QE152_g22017 [Popillia japonica]|uniref:Diamine acetyltransferase 2 n=1 Tax=Popillia japonica TaxID=7064 RepID=A0AAW1KLP2_POPJA